MVIFFFFKSVTSWSSLFSVEMAINLNNKTITSPRATVAFQVHNRKVGKNETKQQR